MASTETLSLSTQTPFGKEQLEEGLQRWPQSLRDCLTRASLFKTLQTKLQMDSEASKSLSKSLQTLSAVATPLAPLLREPTQVEKEGYEQVCFTGTPWSQLNAIPFALIVFSMYKSYIVPGFSLLLPFVSFILPYILLKLFYTIPLSFSDYTSIVWRMWNGQPMPRNPQDLLNPPPAPPTNAATQLKQLVQNGWTLFTLGQAMWQPIQQARHFMRLDADCVSLGSSVVCVKEEIKRLCSSFGSWLPSWLPEFTSLCPTDIRQAFAFALETPFWLRHVFRAIGRFDVLVALAKRSDTVPVEFVNSAQPILMLKDFGDPSIPIERRVLSSIRLGYKSPAHAIVTGPNRGGKSSFLRGVLINVQMAHAFGVAFAKGAQMSRFSWIADGLRLDDNPGEVSMFEREVAFASGLVQKEGGQGLVLYDELFHSTNPPDATRTSHLFCDRLWKKPNCISLISTHVYSLARSAPTDRVKQLCVAAWRHKEKFTFSYAVQKGVCEVSSVDMLLGQYLLA